MKNEEHGSSRDSSHTVDSPLETVGRSILYYLNNDLKFRSTGKDPKGNGYAYAEVPDWALRQWLGGVVQARSGVSISGSEDGEAALVAEEQVAGESSREANETITTLQAKIAGLEGERDEALRYATSLATSLAQRLDAPVDWKPLPDLLGVLSQIDNATMGFVPKARCEAAEQALALVRAPLAQLEFQVALDPAAVKMVREAFSVLDALNPTPQGGKP